MSGGIGTMSDGDEVRETKVPRGQRSETRFDAPSLLYLSLRVEAVGGAIPERPALPASCCLRLAWSSTGAERSTKRSVRYRIWRASR
jgi:hypothetical protein